jgi:hypothetical protein
MRLDVRGDLVEARAMYAQLGYREVPRFNEHPYVEHWFEKRLAVYGGVKQLRLARHPGAPIVCASSP